MICKGDFTYGDDYFLLIIGVILKIIKSIIIFFTSSNDHQKDLIYHEEPADNKPPELRYKNAVYISFRRKVYLAFVAFKEVGYNIVWNLAGDGFIRYEGDISSEGSEQYSVMVYHDDKNLFKLKDPYVIMVSYSFILKDMIIIITKKFLNI